MFDIIQKKRVGTKHISKTYKKETCFKLHLKVYLGEEIIKHSPPPQKKNTRRVDHNVDIRKYFYLVRIPLRKKPIPTHDTEGTRYNDN